MGVFGEEEGIALQRCGVVIITLDKLNQQKPKLRILRKFKSCSWRVEGLGIIRLVCMRIKGYKMLVFRKILRTYYVLIPCDGEYFQQSSRLEIRLEPFVAQPFRTKENNSLLSSSRGDG